MAGFTQNEIEYIRKTSLLKAELDYQSGMTNAKREGLKEGLEKGQNKVLELLEQGLSIDEIKERLKN